MKKILITTNIIILASNYNPTIVSKDWIRQKGIIPEEPINFAHLPVFSLFQSENFILTVDEKRLAVGVKNINESNISKLPLIVEKYITSLPETPYTAGCFNYEWIIQGEEDENLIALLKSIFLQEKNEKKLIEIIGDKDYKIGNTIYFKYNDFMLELNIEPPFTPNEIKISFNYVAMVNNIEELKDVISNYQNTYSHSRNMVEKMWGNKLCQ